MVRDRTNQIARAPTAARLAAAAMALIGWACSHPTAAGQESIETPLSEALAEVDSLGEGEAGPTLTDSFDAHCEDCAAHDQFDEWAPLSAEEFGLGWEAPYFRPFDRLRQLGYRHSSTHGRHAGRGVPLERTSWLNRPLHVDWFVGPLMGDDLTEHVRQSNVVFGGLRFGWDFDYYWGLEWRFGWADPNFDTSITVEPLSGRYFASDVDILYYPWGDSTVRPYLLWGLGLAEVGSLRPDGTGHEATLTHMPFGAGVMFPQTPWLAWRLEILDNVAFGGNGISTMNNVSLTAGMEFRLGARPQLYWPWRSSRNVW